MNSHVDHAYANGNASRWRSTVFGPAAMGFYRNYNNFTLLGGDPASSIIPANDWSIHPEIGNVDAVVRFVVPANALYQIDSSAARLSLHPGTTSVRIEKNGVLQTSQTVGSNGYTYLNLAQLTFVANAGDHIDFVINQNGDPFGDSTGLRAQIQVVPEPATLLGLTMGAWLLRRRPARGQR